MGNANSGRRPRPTAVTELLRGKFGKKANKNDVLPPSGVVRKPRGLSPGAGKVWDELAPLAKGQGTLTVVDVRAFRRVCELEAVLDKCAARKSEPGFQMFDANGRADECIKTERDTSIAVRAFYEKFGLDPSSRARLAMPRSEAPVSKFGLK
jgi:P27 family predicted phage terminase small subunit